MSGPTTASNAVGRSHRRPRRTRPPVPLTILALLIALVSLAPVGYLLLRGGLSPHLLLHELRSPTTGTLVTHTIMLTVSVTVVCIALGVGLALLVVRTDLPLRSLWTVLFALPLGIPAFVTSYTWVATSYRIMPQSTFIYGLRGAVIVLSLAIYPYVYLPVVAALRGLDPAHEETARALGSNAFSAFFRVTLPQLRTAIAGGSLLIALHMMAEFGALELLRYQTLTTAIVQLDAGLRAELREEVRELLQRVGTTAILVTHDQEEALSLADHVAIMRDGLVVQADSPQGIYIAPGDPHIAAFIGEVVLLPGRFVDNPDIPAPCAECALGCVAVRMAGGNGATSEQCMVLLRPEQLEIADHGAAARVVSTSFFGHDGIVRLRLGEDGSGSPVLVRIQGNQLPSTGDLVAVRIAGNRPASVAAAAFSMTR